MKGSNGLIPIYLRASVVSIKELNLHVASSYLPVILQYLSPCNELQHKYILLFLVCEYQFPGKNERKPISFTANHGSRNKLEANEINNTFSSFVVIFVKLVEKSVCVSLLNYFHLSILLRLQQ